MSDNEKVMGGFLVIGQRSWGFGPTLDDAKDLFRRHGGKLNYKHGIYEFDNETEFLGVDGFGTFRWIGNEPTKIR